LLDLYKSINTDNFDTCINSNNKNDYHNDNNNKNDYHNDNDHNNDINDDNGVVGNKNTNDNNNNINNKDYNENIKKNEILLTNHIEKGSRSPKLFQNNPNENTLPCQLILSSKMKPITRTISEWKIWINSKYVHNVRDNHNSMKSNNDSSDDDFSKFQNGLLSWLPNNNCGNDNKKNLYNDNQIDDNPISVKSDIDEKSTHPASVKPDIRGINMNDDNRNDVDRNNRNITFWEVEIELLTGRTHQCRVNISIYMHLYVCIYKCIYIYI
jgi:hypothetical protein